MSAERRFEVTLSIAVDYGYEEVPSTVYFDYQPPEKATPDYPGCEASVTINRVVVKEIDLLPIFTEGLLEEIKEVCLSSVQTGPED